MSRLVRLAIVVFVSALLGAAPVSVRAFDIDINVDVGNPMDLITSVKPKPNPSPAATKPAPAAPAKTSVARLPPKGEKRLLENEVLVETRPDIAAAALAAIATRNGLKLAETADVALLHAKVHRFTIADNRSLRAVLIGLAAERNVLLAQPNYVYTLVSSPTPPASAIKPTTAETSEPAQVATSSAGPPQYSVGLMHLDDAHVLATGRAVKIGILDTAIADVTPDLEGSIIMRYDAAGRDSKDDQSHGTALAGIIAAHSTLVGVAPAAQLLSARAFVAEQGKPPVSQSFVLIKGLDWLATNGAQVVNMSFAGPADPLFLAEVRAARVKGILTIAAAGNDGPKAPPDFPAADPNALGVTATDDANAVLPQANQGDYVAIAAPGVDIIVIAPDGTYATNSGTSMAAAHITGAVALLLERNSSLKPEQLTKLLVDSAMDLGKKGKDSTFGAGLVDPPGALAAEK